MFNASKRETHHPNSGFKKLFRRLRATYKVDMCGLFIFIIIKIRCSCVVAGVRSNKDEIALDRLSRANLVVFGGPRERFSSSEVTS